MITPNTLEEKIQHIKVCIREYTGIQFLNLVSPYDYHSVLPYKIKKTIHGVYICMCYIPNKDKLYTFPIENMMFVHPDDLYTYRVTENNESLHPEKDNDPLEDDSEITPWDDNSEISTLFEIFTI